MSHLISGFLLLSSIPYVIGTAAEDVHRRQAAAPSTLTFSLASSNPTAVPYTVIGSGEPVAATIPLPQTAVAGSIPSSIPNAPPLPDASKILNSNYPPLDALPPLDSAEVAQWKAEVANSGITIPNIPPTLPGGCPANLDAVKDTSRCWWTCGACTRPTDISDCPKKETWGVTYDDGPSPYTPNLLAYLDEQKLKATFYVVGSRCVANPATLQAEYMAGHEIGIHTWSHPALTTLTNDQIIAELGWTRKIIKDVLGVTPLTMRPPYGDIDDRVRAICAAMGLTPVLWTSINEYDGFDTNDWEVHAGTATPVDILNGWNVILARAAARDRGFISLQHDLYQQTVELATGYIVPDGLKNGLTMQPVATCLNKPLGDSYLETSSAPPTTNKTSGSTTGSTTGSNKSNNSTSSGSGSKISQVGTSSQKKVGSGAIALSGLNGILTVSVGISAFLSLKGIFHL